jgi:hypothetical protein
MNGFLTTIPLDILNYEIIPYLDYQGRTALNLALPRKDRQSYRLQTIPLLIDSENTLKFLGNHKDSSWTPIGTSIVIEHPRARRDSEKHMFTEAEMILEQRRIRFQLRRGQRLIHDRIKRGFYERQEHSEMPLKCKCCQAV